MEYLEFLEHMRTLLRSARWGHSKEAGDLVSQINAEIAAEHQRGELALKLADNPEAHPHFRCSQCGDAIWYGERQHVCRGGK